MINYKTYIDIQIQFFVEGKKTFEDCIDSCNEILKEYKNYIIEMNPSNAVERVNRLRVYMLGRLTSAVANLI